MEIKWKRLCVLLADHARLVVKLTVLAFAFAPFNGYDTPLYLFYQAKALADLAPYERILVKGGMQEITGTDKDYTYSAWKHKKEMLILAGNYKSKKNPTVITLPFKKVSRIINLSRKKELPAGVTFSAEVPLNRAELYYVVGK